MKKLISLLLALMMALSLSAGAFAEDTTDVQEILDGLTDEQKTELLGKLLEEVLAELAGGEEETDDRAADVPAYASFGEHLQAFAESLNLEENDIQLDASAMGQNYTVVVGQEDSGFYGKLLSAGTLLGQLKVDNEAACLSYGGMTYGVKFEEIRKLLDKLSNANAAGGMLAELGITPEQLQADAMKVAGWAGALFAKVQPAFSVVQVSETERKATVDAPAFAEAFVAGVDEILAGEDFAELFDRYYGLAAKLAESAGSQLPPLTVDSVKAAWDGAKGQIAQALAEVEMELTLRTGENEYGCSFMAAIPGGTGDKVVLTIDGVLAQDFTSGSASYSVASRQNPDDKLLEGTAAYQLVGTGVDIQIAANFLQGQSFEMSESVRLDMEKTTYSIEQTIAVNGQTYMEMSGWFNWSNFNFDIREKQNMGAVQQGAGVVEAHLSFDGVVLSMEIKSDGQEFLGLNIWGEEVDANNWVLHTTIDQNGQRQAMDLEVSFVPMDPETANEPEVLAASVVMKGDTDMTVAQLTVGAVAKSGAEIDPETVMWLDADTIEAMLKMMQQPQQPAPYDKAPVEEAPAETEAPAAEEEAPAAA